MFLLFYASILLSLFFSISFLSSCRFSPFSVPFSFFAVLFFTIAFVVVFLLSITRHWYLPTYVHVVYNAISGPQLLISHAIIFSSTGTTYDFSFSLALTCTTTTQAGSVWCSCMYSLRLSSQILDSHSTRGAAFPPPQECCIQFSFHKQNKLFHGFDSQGNTIDASSHSNPTLE